MSLETPRHGVQLELSRAWLVQFAERLVFPNHSRGRYANGGFVPDCVAAVRRVERGVAIHYYFPVDGRDPRHARQARTIGSRSSRQASVAHFTNAIDLSADAQLLHLESDPARNQRRMGKLGQTRTHRQRARASLDAR